MKVTVVKKVIFLCMLIMLLPGCGRIIDWGKRSFAQTPTEEIDPAIARNYIRSAVAYDQIATAGKFDALWLSDEVRKTYSQLLAKKFGRTEEQQKASLRRQLEENKHFITFYVLSLYEHPLGDPTSEWAVFLRIDDKNYAPIEVKSVELSPEYIFMFGKRYTRFRVPYSVKFDARTIEDEPIINDDTQKLSLHFRSVNKKVTMTWDIHVNSRADAIISEVQKEEEYMDISEGDTAKNSLDV